MTTVPFNVVGRRAALLLSAALLGGCPPADPPSHNAGTIEFAVFDDPDSDFATRDVLDVDGQIVRFDPATARLIWVPDNLAFDGWPVSGNDLLGGAFRVRFGTRDGQRAAYFTETVSATICEIEILKGALIVSATAQPVPQE